MSLILHRTHKHGPTLTPTSAPSVLSAGKGTFTLSGKDVALSYSGALTTYRGANLPYTLNSVTGATSQMTSPGEDALTTDFGSNPWSDIADFYVGSARYNAATVLTVTGADASARYTSLQTHLATVAAGNNDYIIKLPVATTQGDRFSLPAKTYPTKHCWIVNTDIHAGTFATARGTRIPQSTSGMAIIEGPNTSGSYVINNEQGANHANSRGYSFHGVVIQTTQGSTTQSAGVGIVTLGHDGVTTAIYTITALSQLASRFYFDRCWIRGSSTQPVRRGICLNAPLVHIEDCQITDIHKDGDESAAIGSWTGSRYVSVVNTRLEGAGMCILTGGATPYAPGTGVFDPQDWYCKKVYAYKPPTWNPANGSYDGNGWDVKNHIESKNHHRWLFDAVVAENCWVSAQTGISTFFQNVDETGQNNSTNNCEDIVLRNYLMKNSFYGFGLAGGLHYPQINHCYDVTTNTARVTGYLNTIEDDYYNGATFQITGGTGAGSQVYTITDWVKDPSVDNSLGATVTVSPNWVTPPDSTSSAFSGNWTNYPVPAHHTSRVVLDNVALIQQAGLRSNAELAGGTGADKTTTRVFQFYGHVDDLKMHRVTSDTDTGRWMQLEKDNAFTNSGWSITNVVGASGNGGVLDSSTGGGYGHDKLVAYAGTSAVVSGNVVYGPIDGIYNLSGAGITVPTDYTDMHFNDYTNYDYALTDAYLTSGVSGSRPGVDFTSLNAMLTGVTS